MSRVIQKQGMAIPQGWHRSASREAHGSAGLFSSALFCLWLSTASLVVWVDFGLSPSGHADLAQQSAKSAEPASPGPMTHD